MYTLSVIDADFEYIKVLKENFTSDLILFCGFQFERDSDFNSFDLQNRINQSEIVQNFLCSKIVLNQFQQEVYSGPNRYVSAGALVLEADFQKLNDHEMIDDTLAEILFTGGVHGCTDFQGSCETAKHLAKAFCQEIFEDDYKNRNNNCLRTFSAWNTWFMDGPYTFRETLLLNAKKTKTTWLLAYSTSD
ncbi:MAG: group-specific protein [Mucilaginibacter sp.]|nr:group-specific protein [Mucilaginibacter sp.]